MKKTVTYFCKSDSAFRQRLEGLIRQRRMVRGSVCPVRPSCRPPRGPGGWRSPHPPRACSQAGPAQPCPPTRKQGRRQGETDSEPTRPPPGAHSQGGGSSRTQTHRWPRPLRLAARAPRARDGRRTAEALTVTEAHGDFLPCAESPALVGQGPGSGRRKAP